MTSFLWRHLTLIPGYRKTDGQLVCVKQVPKSRVHQVVPHGDRSIPKEFQMHIQASTCNKVVKVNSFPPIKIVYWFFTLLIIYNHFDGLQPKVDKLGRFTAFWTVAVKIYDLYERKSSYLLVMEKPPNCIDLFEYSRKNGALDEKMAKKIFYQVVEACIDMQKKEVLHRDIKDENILLNEKTNQVLSQNDSSKYNVTIFNYVIVTLW